MIINNSNKQLLFLFLTLIFCLIISYAWLPIKIIILWTDGFLFLLLLLLTIAIKQIWKKPHLRKNWQQVFKHRLGMSSAIILLTYASIGILDSLHFRFIENQAQQNYSALYSVLDLALLPLKEQTEKTYSAPFATHLYSKENIELENGQTQRDYPRLHSAKTQDRDNTDIIFKMLQGILLGLLATGIALLLLCYLLFHSFFRISQLRDILKGNTTLPWNSALFTLMLIFISIGMIITLSNGYHIFGTDKVGQDVLYLSIKSIRTGLLIGTLATLILLPIALLLGIMAGYFRGWVDDIIQYLYTTLNSIPGVLLITAAVLMVEVQLNNSTIHYSTEERADLRLLFLCIILGTTSWTGLCRLLRAETLKLREMEYIQAARAFGVHSLTLMHRHIVPNVMHLVLISLVLDFSSLVLAEAVLSYIGVGVDPTMHSWGNMINGARLEMAREPVVWWTLVAAFSFMFTLVLAVNIFADSIRDAFDPRFNSNS